MREERIIKAIIFIFIGCFILYSEQISFAPGAVAFVKDFKYIIAGIFFSMALFLIVNRNK